MFDGRALPRRWFVLHRRSTVRVIDPRHIKMKVSTWFRGQMKAVPNEQLLTDWEAPIPRWPAKSDVMLRATENKFERRVPVQGLSISEIGNTRLHEAISKKMEYVDAECPKSFGQGPPASLSRRLAAACRRVSKSHSWYCTTYNLNWCISCAVAAQRRPTMSSWETLGRAVRHTLARKNSS